MVGLAFDFLEAEDVGLVVFEELLEGAFSKDGAEAVDVPREDFNICHGRSPSF